MERKPHAAWLAVAESPDLAWRLAACRAPHALPVEMAQGGLLKVLQREGRVAVQARGGINEYLGAERKAELASAVQAYLRSTADPWYGVSPKTQINYGGKGAGQQLWFTDGGSWRVTQPNRLMLRLCAELPSEPLWTQRATSQRTDDTSTRRSCSSAGRGSSEKEPTKRQRVANEGDDDELFWPQVDVPLSPRDIDLLPSPSFDHGAHDSTPPPILQLAPGVPAAEMSLCAVDVEELATNSTADLHDLTTEYSALLPSSSGTDDKVSEEGTPPGLSSDCGANDLPPPPLQVALPDAEVQSSPASVVESGATHDRILQQPMLELDTVSKTDLHEVATENPLFLASSSGTDDALSEEATPPARETDGLQIERQTQPPEADASRAVAEQKRTRADAATRLTKAEQQTPTTDSTQWAGNPRRLQLRAIRSLLTKVVSRIRNDKTKAHRPPDQASHDRSVASLPGITTGRTSSSSFQDRQSRELAAGIVSENDRPFDPDCRSRVARSQAWVRVPVKRGDSLQKFAVAYGLEVSEIKSANNILHAELEPWRDEVWLPSGAKAPDQASDCKPADNATRRGGTSSSFQHQHAKASAGQMARVIATESDRSRDPDFRSSAAESAGWVRVPVRRGWKRWY